MGLDAGIYKFKKNEVPSYNDELYSDFEKRECAYWRKEWGIHDFFKTFYKSENGETYDGQPIRIKKKHLKLFKKELKDKDSIVYFQSPWDNGKYIKKAFRKQLKKCNRALKKGYRLYYLASW